MALHAAVILLDEPTSGLDSASAYHVITNLRNLARSGRTIVATIHQPSSEVFALFDKVCILTQGNMVYFGGAYVCVHVHVHVCVFVCACATALHCGMVVALRVDLPITCNSGCYRAQGRGAWPDDDRHHGDVFRQQGLPVPGLLQRR